MTRLIGFCLFIFIALFSLAAAAQLTPLPVVGSPDFTTTLANAYAAHQWPMCVGLGLSVLAFGLRAFQGKIAWFHTTKGMLVCTIGAGVLTTAAQTIAEKGFTMAALMLGLGTLVMSFGFMVNPSGAVVQSSTPATGTPGGPALQPPAVKS